MEGDESRSNNKGGGGAMSLNDRHNLRLFHSLSTPPHLPLITPTHFNHQFEDAMPNFNFSNSDFDDAKPQFNFHDSDSDEVVSHAKSECHVPTDIEEKKVKYTEEEKKSKVKIQGRRRLCKASSAAIIGLDNDQTNDRDLIDFDFNSPSPKNKDTGGEGDIRDILNDLSSRLDLLSIEKKPAPRNVNRERVTLPFVDAENVDLSSSASSPFPVACYSSSDAVNQTSIRGGMETWAGKNQEANVFESSNVVGKVNKIKNHPKGQDRVIKKSEPVKHTSAATFEDSDDEDDDCRISSGSKFVKKVEGSRGNIQKKFDDSDVLDINSDDDVSGDDGSIVMSSSTSKYVLPGKIGSMLYPHQREGLKWLWSLHTLGKGGILGDDMGLGKTMQICGFLVGMFHSKLVKRVLIVAPKTLLPHWIKELSVVGLSAKTREYFGTDIKYREYELQSVLKGKGILLTTYDIVRNNTKSLRGDRYLCDDDVMWDYMILDEGHLIKNPDTQRAKSLLEIPSAHRIIISGTPIQNNLKELWALFNFSCPELLGDKKWFKEKYEAPILRGNDKNASDRDKRIGSAVAKDLREHIQPYFLRRLKSDVFRDDDSKEAAKLSKKDEIIVWLKLTGSQRRIYEAYLKSELVLSAFDGSPLAALTILKKICDHPLLLTKRAAEDVLEGMDLMMNPDDNIDAEKLAQRIADVTEISGFEGNHENISCKISFIVSLLNHLIPEGHRVLIFSQTRKMLNLIQDSLAGEGYNFLRIDGTTKSSDRVQVVNDFQEGNVAPIFLLTSQVGGLGLTLTKADRVIVVDPAWNPSTDNQSVDRAYRIGQEKDVVVYRLMTCGTIEEKIYRKQIYKGGLFRTATEHKEQTRYFSQQDLRELFSIPKQGFDVSPTQQQLFEEHDSEHTMSDFLKTHVKFLETLGIAGVSQHSLLFSKTESVSNEEVVISEKETKFMENSFMGNSSSTSRIELDVEGAKYAFNPKDVKLNKRSPSKDVTQKRTESEVNDRIGRLSKMLGDKILVSRLRDNGNNLRKQLAELETELDILCRSRKSDNVISLDDISEDFQKVLNV